MNRKKILSAIRYTAEILAVTGLYYIIVRLGLPSGDVTALEWVGILAGFMLIGSFLVYVNSRKKMETILLRSEAEFRALAEDALTGVARYEFSSGKILYANKSAAHMFGFISVEDLLYNDIRPYILDKQQLAALTQTPQSSAKIYNQEMEILTAAGEKCYVLYSASLHQDIVSITLADISERKKSEAALRESEERFQSLFTSSAAIILLIDPDSGEILDANPTAIKFYGYSIDQLTAMNIAEINQFPSEEVRTEHQKAKREERNYFVFPHRLSSGEVRTVEVRSHPIKTKNKVILFSIIYDITERKQVEEALNESKLLFHLLIESLPQNIYAKDIDGRFIFANRHYCTTQGKSLEEIVGKTDFEIHSYELAEKYRLEDQRVINTGESIEMEEVHAPIGEKKFFAQVIKTPFYDNKGQTSGTLGIFWDMTERKESEELLRQKSEQLRILYEATQRLNRTLNLNEIYQAICDFMSSVALNDGLVISAFDHETQLITCRAYWIDNDWMDVSLFPSIPLEAEGKGTQSIVIRTGQSMLVNDYQTQVKTAQTTYSVDSETNEVNQETPPDEEVTRSALIVPLKTGEMVTGAIQVLSYDLNAYTEDQLQLLEALAVHIVSAEKNALLYAQAQAELNEREQAEMLQEMVYQIAESAHTTESMQDLYPKIHNSISNVMFAENFYIALYDETDDLLSFVYAVDKVDHTIIEPIHPGKGLTAYVLRTGKSLLLSPAQGTTEIEIIGVPSMVWLGVPLIVRGKTIGVMAVQHYSDAQAYTEREQHILEFASLQVATAIDRKQAEEAVQLVKKRNTALIENVPGGIAMLDTRGIFKFCSPSAYRMFGYTPEEIIGNNSLKWTHPDDTPRIRSGVLNLLRDPSQVFVIEYRFLHKDGSYRWLECTFSNLLAEPGVNALVNNFRDITESKQAAILQETVYRIAEAAQNVQSLQDLYPQIQNNIAKVMYAKNFYIALHDEASAMFRFVYDVDEIDAEKLEPFQSDKGLTGHVLRTGKSLLFRPEHGSLDIQIFGLAPHVWLGVPLIVQGKTIGVMAVQHYFDSQAYTEREQRILEFVSSQVATAIDRKQAEESVRRIEKRNSAIIENAPDGIVLLDIEGTFKFASPSAYRMFGYTLQEVIGHDPAERMHPDDAPLVLGIINKSQTDPSAVFTLEYRFLHKDGSYRWLESTYSNLFAEPGVNAMVVNFRDITESKLAQELLRKSRSSLEMAQSIAHLGSWEFDTETGVGLWSREMFQLFHRDSRLGSPSLSEFANLIHPDDRQPLLDAQQRAIEMDTLVTIDCRTNPVKNKVQYFKATIYSVRDAQGQLVNVSGTMLDITEIKNAQYDLEELNRNLEKRVEERTAEVRQSEATYRALFENSNDGIFLFSPMGEALQANQQGLDIIGYTMEEWRSNHRNKLVPNYQHLDADARFEAAYRGERVPLYERTLISKGGKKVETEINLSAIRDANGKVIFVQSVVRDVTERKRAETMLRESSELFSEFMLHSPVFTFIKEVTPSQGLVLYASENFAEMIGIPGNEMIGKTMSDLFPAEFAKKIIEDDWAVIANNKMIRLEEELNGRNYTSIKFPILQGDKTLLAGYTIDVTERNKAEEALRESRDKLSAANAALEKASRLKNEFLASMSHELRTPLTGILGLAEALQLQVFGALNEKQIKSLKNIENSGRHLLDLINDILDLSKIEAGKLDMQFEPSSAADICQASLQLVKGMVHQKRQNLSFSMNPVSINVRADARRLKQMLVNLLSNAVKFTPEGGSLGLEVSGNKAENAILFSVWDKGIGIKPEELGKLFKPFIQLDSSLARQYSGTGLGLSLVQRMAELHGGSVKVESTPDEGSRFTIILPWSEDITQPIHGLKDRDTGPLKSTLVIEDNILDAEHITRYLKEIGIINIVQPTLQGALEKAATMRPGVILLDLHLSDGFGLNLLTQLKADKRTCNIPVIITSVEERQSEALQLGAIGYLVKPFTQKELHTELANAATFIDPTDPVMVIASPASIPLVMIADDNELILELITDFLEGNGYRVIAARNGFELLECAPELHPDIMLVDIQMPGMDGMETIRRLRAHHDPQIAVTPIIAVTALAMSGDREKCLQAGANEYMSKPIVLRQLVERVSQLLKEKHQ